MKPTWGWSWGEGRNKTEVCGKSVLTMYVWTLVFVRSGYFNLPTTAGTFRNAGIIGGWWALRGSSTHADGSMVPSAYHLHVNAKGIYPSGGPYGRSVGFPLRCLSTVLGR